MRARKIYVPATTRMHYIPTTVPLPKVVVAFDSLSIVRDLVATIGEHCNEPADIHKFCIF